ncbi:MAG: radical SAM protein [Candidatus Omnitrophota bacterium]|jgi:radical SAM superfamily enzyme YgiQ (UPF0313 family)
MKKSVYIIQCPPSWTKTAPLSLVYLENYLKSKSIKVKTRDLNNELFKTYAANSKTWLALDDNFEKNLFPQTKITLLPFLDSFYKDIVDYEYIGFSLLKRNTDFSFSLANEIRKKFPSKKIIFGGPQVLFMKWKKCLNDTDFWVIGEGEMPLLKILSGEQNKTYHHEEITNLDDLDFLDFSCLDMLNYSNSIPILSSRGCKFNCNFCAEKELFKGLRHHSAGYMIELINKLKKEHNTNSFIFSDSLINYDNAWLNDFCSSLIKKNMNIKWEAQIRVDKNFDTNLSRIMQKSGCYNLFIGLESASDKTLKNMNKGFSAQAAADFLSTLKSADLQFEISLIFGYPGETEADFRETLDFIIKNKRIIPKIAQANPFVDYLDNFPQSIFPSKIAKERIAAFLKVIENEKIKYTKSFINNLVY